MHCPKHYWIDDIIEIACWKVDKKIKIEHHYWNME